MKPELRFVHTSKGFWTWKKRYSPSRTMVLPRPEIVWLLGLVWFGEKRSEYLPVCRWYMMDAGLAIIPHCTLDFKKCSICRCSDAIYHNNLDRIIDVIIDPHDSVFEFHFLWHNNFAQLNVSPGLHQQTRSHDQLIMWPVTPTVGGT